MSSADTTTSASAAASSIPSPSLLGRFVGARGKRRRQRWRLRWAPCLMASTFPASSPTTSPPPHSSSPARVPRLLEWAQKLECSSSILAPINVLGVVLGQEIDDARVITLNRPRQLNGISDRVVYILAQFLEKWEQDENAKLVIFKGAGRVFSAGGDLKMFYEGKSDDSCLEVVYRMYWLCYHIHTYKKTTVALVNGLVMGGGTAMVAPLKFAVVTDKIVASDSFVVKTLDRKNLWEMQTPQVMKPNLLTDGFELVKRDSLEVTDDVSIVEYLKHHVYVTEGSYTNIKVTTPDDLLLAERLMNEK